MQIERGGKFPHRKVNTGLSAGAEGRDHWEPGMLTTVQLFGLGKVGEYVAHKLSGHGSVFLLTKLRNHTQRWLPDFMEHKRHFKNDRSHCKEGWTH